MRTLKAAKNPTLNIEIIIDPYIHEQATKLSRTAFLERIDNVKAIRTREIKIGFYLSEIKKLMRLENLHQIVNSGKFAGQKLTNNKLFAVGLPQKLFSWLRNTSLPTFHKQILHWHAAYYAFNSFQEFADEELDPLILQELKKILNQYYPERYKGKFTIDDSDDGVEYYAKRDAALKYYLDVSSKYTGSLPPEFLKNPYSEPTSNIAEGDYGWGLFPGCQFSILISYFNILDWIIIIERNKEKLKEFHKSSIDNKKMSMKEIEDIIAKADDDILQRAESDSEMWQKWKYTFQNYETRKEYTYSIVPKNEARIGYVYLNQDETGATKIGWTTKEGTERILGVQTGNPTNIKERGRFNASSTKTEKILHKLFEGKKTREGGEWFWLTEEDIQNILDSDWRMRKNIF